METLDRKESKAQEAPQDSLGPLAQQAHRVQLVQKVQKVKLVPQEKLVHKEPQANRDKKE
jgi:hypothetical protein